MFRPLRLLPIALGTLIVPLDTAVNIAFPGITQAFGLPVSAIQWVVVCYMLVYGSLLLACGRVGDIYGHAAVFRVGLAWSVVAFLLCAWAPSYGWLLACRALQGIGAALVLSCGPALATAMFAESLRPRALGAYAMVIALGGALGPMLGGVLVQSWGWEAVFWFRAPIALLALVLSWRILPAVAAPDARQASGFLGAAPILDLRLFRSVDFALVNVANVLLNFAGFAVLLLAPYYLVRALDGPLGIAGVLLSAGGIGTVAVSPLAGRWIGRASPYALCMLGAMFVALGLGMVCLWPARADIAWILAALLLQGGGLGLFQVAYMDIVTARMPREDRGVAGSLAHLTRTIGILAGATVLSFLFQSFEPAQDFLVAFRQTFGIAALSAAVVAVAILARVRRWPR